MRKRWCPLAGILSPFGRKREGGTIAVSVALTGLTSNAQYDNYAEIGSDVTLTADGGAPSTVAWGSTPGGSDYGTTATITVSGANDTGSPSSPAILYYSGDLAGEPFAGAVAIRSELPVNTVAPAISNSDPTGSDFGDTVSINNGTWTAPAVVSYVRRLLANGVVEAEGATPFFVIDASHDQATIAGDVTATTSAGVVAVSASGSFVVDDFTAPVITGVPTVSGTAQVGQTLTLTAASVAGNPTPTRTWQKRHDGTASGATFTGTSYLIVEGDEGFALSFDQIETNNLGSDSATSAATDAVAEGVAAITVTFGLVEQQPTTGTVNAAYTISANDTVELVQFPATDPDPTAGDFNTGSTNLAGYYDLGTVALTVGGSNIPLTGPDGAQGNYKIAAMTSTGHIAVSASFALDSTDSVLSPVAFVAGAGNGEVDWSFTPDEDSDGTLGYRVSLWADGSTPSAADIESGTGSVATVTGIATGGVAETGTLTGASGVTYVPTIWYVDLYANEDTNTYADVTAATVTPLSGTMYGATTTLSDQTTNTFSGLDFGAADPTRVIEVMIMAWDNTGPRTISSVTIGGVTATQVVAYAVAGANPTGTAVYRATVPTGTTGSIVVTFSGAVARCMTAWARIVGGTLQTSASDKKTSAAQSVNVNVGAGNTVVCLLGGRSLTFNVTGMTGTTSQFGGSNSSRVGGVVDNAASAATPRTVTQSTGTSDSAHLYVSVWS